MNLILKKLLVKMNTCRQRAILTIDASDKLLPILLIYASDRERERSLASNVIPCGSVVVSTSALHDRILSSRPAPGMGMFGVKTWLSTLETEYLS